MKKIFTVIGLIVLTSCIITGCAGITINIGDGNLSSSATLKEDDLYGKYVRYKGTKELKEIMELQPAGVAKYYFCDENYNQTTHDDDPQMEWTLDGNAVRVTASFYIRKLGEPAELDHTKVTVYVYDTDRKLLLPYDAVKDLSDLNEYDLSSEDYLYYKKL